MVLEHSGVSNMAWAAWNLHFFDAATYKLAFWDFKITIKTKLLNIFTFRDRKTAVRIMLRAHRKYRAPVRVIHDCDFVYGVLIEID